MTSPDGPPAPEMGLRELKKQMTHESIAEAALRLTLEKGLDDVTIEEIARQAFVSPRTVSNYFASKEEAIVVAGTPPWMSAVEEFGAGPRTKRPLAALCEVLAGFVEALSDEQLRLWLQTIALVDKYPALRPYASAEFDKLEGELRGRVAHRTGSDPETEMYPWLAAAAAVAATRSALRMWAQRGGPEGGLPVLIRAAFTEFINGLPTPSSAGEDAPAT